MGKDNYDHIPGSNANKTLHQTMVDKFMGLAKQELPESPCIPSREVRELRAKLIYEEAIETINGLGFSVVYLENHNHPDQIGLHLVEDREPNLVEIIDGCCDLKVVTTGTLSACGVPDLPFQVAVDTNNLAKFGPGHSWREDGKLIKPPGHQPPDIQGILDSLNVSKEL